jgi:hypothetical protein
MDKWQKLENTIEFDLVTACNPVEKDILKRILETMKRLEKENVKSNN